MAINKKHLAFIDEYFLSNYNATEAYMRVYAPNSRDAARANGAKLLANANILEAIEERFKERALSANQVIDGLSEIAKNDIGDFMAVSSMGFSLDLEQARERGLTKHIKKIKQKTTIFSGKKEEDDREVHEIEIELYSRHDALRDLGKYHALFTDKTRAEDWRTDLLALLKKGDVSPEDILKSLDPETAKALLRDAGVQ